MNRRGVFLPTLVWAFFLASARAFALDPSKSIVQYSLDVRSARDGLPQNTVAGLRQTSDGYLWFGTEEGLVRFDGVSFTVFSTRNTPSFRQNIVETVQESSDKSLWIATLDGLLRKRGDFFTAYHAEDGLASESVHALLEEPDGSMWIGTDAGLTVWRRDRFGPAHRSELPGQVVLSLARSADGSIWIGTDHGLARMTGKDFVSYGNASGALSSQINGISQARSGMLWVATAQGLVGLRDGRVSVAFTRKNGLPSDITYTVLEDRRGNLWIGTAGGLARLRSASFEILSTAEGLPNDVVISLEEDREGNLWVGTDGGGLACLRDGPLVTYTRRDGLSNDFIRAVLEDTQGTMWIGTRGGGLNRFYDGRFMALTTRDGLPGDSITALTQTRDGAVWVGTSGGGLVRWKNGFRQSSENWNALTPSVVRVLFEDTAGALWVGTNSGLRRLFHDELTEYSSRNGLAGEIVVALCEGSDGALWVGTTSGLSRLQNGTWTSFSRKDGLSSESMRSLHAEADGTVWIGTSGGGLVRYRNGRFASVTARQGLYDDVVFAILDDGAGRFWMSCNRGIFRVDRQELDDFFDGRRSSVTSVAYGEADGMQSAECNGSFQPAGWRGHDGRLWFPTIRGLTVVDPAAVRTNTLAPPVVLERLVVNGRDVVRDGPVSLPAGTRSLEIHYTGLSLATPGQMRFQYRLDGLDGEWVDAGMRRVAYYTNLRAGHYTFRVIACNSDGVWNRVGATLPITIRPLFTETFVFFGLCIAAVIAAVVLVYRARVQRLRAHERELEAGIQEALSNIRVLRGLFPICASCKKIRDDRGYWKQIESYIRDHSEAEFSHSICPECMQQLYPEFASEHSDTTTPDETPS